MKNNTSTIAMPGSAGLASTADIITAEKNVHASEMRDDASFQGLLTSIKQNGIIHRLIVRRDEAKGKYVLIDGHRRYAAAVTAGIKEVPVDVRDVTENEAMSIMLAANVQRLENDPILEAEVIEDMSKAGYTYDAIAAAMGKTAGYVTRRARLLKLTKVWRDFAKRVPCTIDFLEKVAAHEPQLQDLVAVNCELEDFELDEEGGKCEWAEFRHLFTACTQKLDGAIFNTSQCENCSNNTGCHRYLFDFMNRDEEVCYCQNRSCYIAKHNAVIDERIATLKRKGKSVIEVASKWNIPEYWDATEEPTKIKAQAYLYTDNGIKHLLFSIERVQTRPEGPQKTPEEREQEKILKKRQKLLRAARDKLHEVVKVEPDGSLPEIFTSRAGKAAFARIAGKHLKAALDSDWVSDNLLDMVMTEMHQASEIREALSAEEHEAYCELINDLMQAEGTDMNG